MGLDCTVQFPGGAVPDWDAIKGRLASVGEPAPLRMIDGQPAYPNESPADGWRELRVGSAAGMVTIRRDAGALHVIVWGSADAALLTARDRVAWACAAAGDGAVGTPEGELSAAEFAARARLSPS